MFGYYVELSNHALYNKARQEKVPDYIGPATDRPGGMHSRQL